MSSARLTLATLSVIHDAEREAAEREGAERERLLAYAEETRRQLDVDVQWLRRTSQRRGTATAEWTVLARLVIDDPLPRGRPPHNGRTVRQRLKREAKLRRKRGRS